MSEWISAKDRPPEYSDDFLCFVSIPNIGLPVYDIRILEYFSGAKIWDCDGMIVTHWMPLPDPPEVGP